LWYDESNSGLPSNHVGAIDGSGNKWIGTGNEFFIGGLTVYNEGGVLLGVEDKMQSGSLVSDFRLNQNYPNPFSPMTTIQYDIPKITHVILSIYNMNGQLVERLVNQKQEPRFYSVNWGARNVSTGVYFYQIRADDFHQVKKCLLIK
jgi:hypothetical protein